MSDMTPHFPIYLDYGATTPVDPRVVDAMVPWLYEHFGNAASRSHAWGWEAEAAIEKARGHVAELINADPREIVKAGDVVKVKVLEVDAERKRIALTMRLDDDPTTSGKKDRPRGDKRPPQKQEKITNTAMADAFAKLRQK